MENKIDNILILVICIAFIGLLIFISKDSNTYTITDKRVDEIIRIDTIEIGGSTEGAIEGSIIGGMFGFPTLGAIVGSSKESKITTDTVILKKCYIELNDSIWLRINEIDYHFLDIGEKYKQRKK